MGTATVENEEGRSCLSWPQRPTTLNLASQSGTSSIGPCMLPPEAMRGPLPATAKYTWQKKHGDARALPNHVLRHAFPDSGTPTAISGKGSSRHGACLGLAAGESREERAGKNCKERSTAAGRSV